MWYVTLNLVDWRVGGQTERQRIQVPLAGPPALEPQQELAQQTQLSEEARAHSRGRREESSPHDALLEEEEVTHSVKHRFSLI